MKMMRVLAAAMAIGLLAAGCSKRNEQTTPGELVSEAVSSIERGAEDITSRVEEGTEDLASRVEDGVSHAEQGISRAEDRLESRNVSDVMDPVDTKDPLIADENVAAAMSTDFSQIGALDSKKYEWGSGGPTDGEGRPNGATGYQKKFSDYDMYFIAPDEKIYLTFDEGYENSFTPDILDTLKEKEVSAVFFITYPYARDHADLVQRMIDDGHIIGNHSTKHLSFPDMPLNEAAKDILQLHEYMLENFNYEMTLFRPPMGQFSEQTLALAESLGYTSVFWSFAYKDWLVDAQPDPAEALTNITGKAHPGAIYLLHAVSQTNAQVLEEVIDSLRNQGYELAKWDLLRKDTTKRAEAFQQSPGIPKD